MDNATIKEKLNRLTVYERKVMEAALPFCLYSDKGLAHVFAIEDFLADVSRAYGEEPLSVDFFIRTFLWLYRYEVDYVIAYDCDSSYDRFVDQILPTIYNDDHVDFFRERNKDDFDTTFTYTETIEYMVDYHMTNRPCLQPGVAA